MDFAGSDLNEYLRFLLYELGLHFQTQWDVLIRGIKEKACYVALNFNAELQGKHLMTKPTKTQTRRR